ncbi:unnamed protein product, partial [Cochlearia groenlandica]
VRVVHFVPKPIAEIYPAWEDESTDPSVDRKLHNMIEDLVGGRLDEDIWNVDEGGEDNGKRKRNVESKVLLAKSQRRRIPLKSLKKSEENQEDKKEEKEAFEIAEESKEKKKGPLNEENGHNKAEDRVEPNENQLIDLLISLNTKISDMDTKIDLRLNAMESRVGNLEGSAKKGKKAVEVNVADAQSQAKGGEDCSKDKDSVRKIRILAHTQLDPYVGSSLVKRIGDGSYDPFEMVEDTKRKKLLAFVETE